jgi:hypothetical protein
MYWGRGDAAADEAQWQRRSWQASGLQVFVPGTSDSDARKAVLAVLEAPSPRPTSVLYLFCRCEVGDGSDIALRFGSTASLSDTVLRADFPTVTLPDRPLVFANACTTVAADPYLANELERRFFSRGARAFIGTEVRIPVVLASRFAATFFHLFDRRGDPAPIPAGDALARARTFLWTHYRNIGGVFYSCINEDQLYRADDDELIALRD